MAMPAWRCCKSCADAWNPNPIYLLIFFLLPQSRRCLPWQTRDQPRFGLRYRCCRPLVDMIEAGCQAMSSIRAPKHPKRDRHKPQFDNGGQYQYW